MASQRAATALATPCLQLTAKNQKPITGLKIPCILNFSILEISFVSKRLLRYQKFGKRAQWYKKIAFKDLS
jgi:hypothetical protein